VPECQKIGKGGLDQYGTERFGRLIFATIRKETVEPKGLRCSSLATDLTLTYVRPVILTAGS